MNGAKEIVIFETSMTWITIFTDPDSAIIAKNCIFSSFVVFIVSKVYNL